MTLFETLAIHMADSFFVLDAMIRDKELQASVIAVAQELVTAFRRGNKLLICGNGGSAADAQHLAAEFVGRYQNDKDPGPVGRFKMNRDPLPAIALTDPVILTAISNDYGFNDIFYRQIKAYAKDGDMVWGLTTSANSINVLTALQHDDICSVLFSGEAGRNLHSLSHKIIIPSHSTPIIQQGIMVIGHAICGMVEKEMFGE